MKYVRCDSHCKYPAYDKEEMDNLLKDKANATEVPKKLSDLVNDRVVYDHTLTENASEIEVTGLDMVADGGEYEITMYHVATSHMADSKIQINGITNGYHQLGNTFKGSYIDVEGDLTVITPVYRPNMPWIYYGLVSPTNPKYPATMTGKFFMQSENTLAYSLKNECVVPGLQEFVNVSGVQENEVTNLTSIKIFKENEEFCAGTRLIIKKVL